MFAGVADGGNVATKSGQIHARGTDYEKQVSDTPYQESMNIFYFSINIVGGKVFLHYFPNAYISIL